VYRQPFPDLDHAVLAEHLEVAAQIPFGERAEPLEVREQDTCGLRGKGGQHAEACPFVEHWIETVEGIAAEPIFTCFMRGRI
jgi:hypothetical protein